MRVRFLVRRLPDNSIKLLPAGQPILTLPVANPMILIAQNCELTLFEQGRYKGHSWDEIENFNKRFASFYERETQERIKHDREVKAHYCPICKKQFEIPIRTERHTIGNSTITVTGCPTCILNYRDELFKIQTAKHKAKTIVSIQKFQKSFIETVKTGSHRDHKEWKGYGGKKHTSNDIVTDYKTVFNDCLPGKEWLEAHYQDVIPEPTIELIIGDKEPVTFNDNYKPGVIKEFIKTNKK
jgi:RNase P subunit RPR2